MRCSHCGKDIDESVFPPPLSYCPYCGQSLKTGTEGAAEHVHFCPHCGKELPAGRANFCPYCGGEIARPTAIPHHEQEAIEPIEHKTKPVIEPPPEHKKKSGKLYKQWVKYANLPPQAIPSTEASKEPISQKLAKLEKGAQRLPILYILLGFCIIVVIVSVSILIGQSC